MSATVPITDWLQGSQGRQAARFSALLLGVWVTWQLAKLTWVLIPVPSLPQPPEQRPSAVRQVAAAPEAQGIARIPDWHLFGEATAAAKPAAAGPIDAPETRLNLTLKGVYSAEIQDDARAIIAAAGSPEKTYAIGAQIPGGARLSEVYPDRVILERGGRYETLRLPREASASAPISRRQSPNQNRATPVPDGGAADPGQVLRDYREKMAQNPAVLLDIARPEAYREGDTFVGFKLHPGNKRELFDQFGLQKGDVITEVNGIQLDNPGQGAAVLQAISEGDQLSLTVRRNGEDVSLAFQIP